MAQLMPLPLTISCSSKIQIGFTFLVPAYPGCPGKEAVKWLWCGCDGPWASPYNERKKLAPTPENLAKMGVKFFGGGAISISWGQYCRGRLKSGKGVY